MEKPYPPITQGWPDKMNQIKLNILTNGFKVENAQAFFYPLIKYRRKLKNIGITWKAFEEISAKLYECDILIVENNFFRAQWKDNTNIVIGHYAKFKDKVKKVIHFDLQSHSGMPHTKMLPYVDLYVKKQLLKNQSIYLKSFHGHRVFTDYYFNNFGVTDTDDIYSEPIANENDLGKLRLGWNSSLANYTFLGPYRSKLYRITKLPFFLKFPKPYAKPANHRSNALSCRISTKYTRNTITYQREQLSKALASELNTNRVARKQYYQELASSQIVVSPFGWGEICYRDYEVFLAGSTLVKPDMSHLETWPNLYIPNETYIPFKWDISDAREVIEEYKNDKTKCLEIASKGQNNYAKYLTGDDAAEMFCNRFYNLITS